jgi:hypothetical protein
MAKVDAGRIIGNITDIELIEKNLHISFKPGTDTNFIICDVPFRIVFRTKTLLADYLKTILKKKGDFKSSTLEMAKRSCLLIVKIDIEIPVGSKACFSYREGGRDIKAEFDL